MKNWKHYAVIVMVLITAAIILGGVFAEPVWAQVRPALVRDIDTPALAPFTASVDYTLCCLNDQRLLTTVPAGKRLVIDHISYYSAGEAAGGDELIFGALRNGQFGPLMVILEIHPPHASATSSFTIQDGSQPVKAYFEAGQEVWVSASHNTGGARSLQMRVTGHFITP